MCETVFEQSALIILQSITRALDLDHSIAPLLRPKLHQIGKSRAVSLHVAHDPFEPKPKMRGRDASQRPFQQTLVQQPPIDKCTLDAGFLCKVSANGRFISIGFQLRKALGKFTASASIESAAR
jgi:hypothetical protein